jgi:FtsZ-binding cell division protein ZapB
VPRRDADSPPPPSHEVERLRDENAQLREDLRRSEAERQRLRRENEKLKKELAAARRARVFGIIPWIY